MLTWIDVKFIFDSLPLGLSNSTNILQIANVTLRVVLLFLPCFQRLLRRVPAVVLTLETTEMSAIFFLQPKQLNLVPRSSRLTCSGLHFLTSFLVKHKRLSNLVIINWLW